MTHSYSLGFPGYGTIGIFELTQLLSIKTSHLYLPCGVPVGLANPGCCAMATSTQSKQRAVKCDLDLCQVYEFFLVNYKYLLFGFHQFNCLKTSLVIQARSQQYACKFYSKFNECKGLKTPSLCMHTNCILLASMVLLQVKIPKTFKILPSKHEILYTEVDYAFSLNV